MDHSHHYDGEFAIQRLVQDSASLTACLLGTASQECRELFPQVWQQILPESGHTLPTRNERAPDGYWSGGSQEAPFNIREGPGFSDR